MRCNILIAAVALALPVWAAWKAPEYDYCKGVLTGKNRFTSQPTQAPSPERKRPDRPAHQPHPLTTPLPPKPKRPDQPGSHGKSPKPKTSTPPNAKPPKICPPESDPPVDHGSGSSGHGKPPKTPKSSKKPKKPKHHGHQGKKGHNSSDPPSGDQEPSSSKKKHKPKSSANSSSFPFAGSEEQSTCDPEGEGGSNNSDSPPDGSPSTAGQQQPHHSHQTPKHDHGHDHSQPPPTKTTPGTPSDPSPAPAPANSVGHKSPSGPRPTSAPTLTRRSGTATTDHNWDGTAGSCGCGSRTGKAFDWQIDGIPYGTKGEILYTALGSAELYHGSENSCSSSCGNCFKITSKGFAPDGNAGSTKGTSILVMLVGYCSLSSNKLWCSEAGKKNDFGYTAHFTLNLKDERLLDAHNTQWSNPVVDYLQVQCPSEATASYNTCNCHTHT